MDISKYYLTGTSKPTVNSAKEPKICIKNLSSRPPRSRASSISKTFTDTRPASTSPSRQLVPLSLVTSSNVSISLDLQKKLLSNTNQRKTLALSMKNENESPKIDTTYEPSIMNSQCSKDSFKMKRAKDCVFGLPERNKENNYVSLYHKHRNFKEKLRNRGRKPENNRSCLKSDENEQESWRSKMIQEMDSREIERRYQSITSKLDKMSKSIQEAISNSNYS